MSLTVDYLQNFYGSKPLFSRDLVMALMRKLDRKIDLIKLIYLYANEKKKKYFFDDLSKFSNIIVNLGNAIINDTVEYEYCESLVNFNNDNLAIIGDSILEVLPQFKEDYSYIHCNGSDNQKSSFIIKCKIMLCVRYYVITFYSGRLSRRSSGTSQRTSSRSVVTTFKMSKVRNV